MSLSAGSIQSIYSSKTSGSHVLQVLDIKRLTSNQQNAERFRLTLSDGMHYMQAMLTSQLNDMVKDSSVQKTCIVRINECMCNSISNRRIVIILAMAVEKSAPCEPIGSPTNIEDAQAQAVTNMPNPAAPKPVPQVKAEPTVGYQSKGAVAMDASSAQVISIKDLNPYMNSWTIRARLMSKSEMKQWSNARGEGRLFSVDMMDATGELRGVFFNQTADRFYEMLQAGKVYEISKGTIKVPQRKWGNSKAEYEITFNDNSTFNLVSDDQVPKITYNFTSISDMEKVEPRSFVDVIGIVQNVGPESSITPKSGINQGKTIPKREVTLVDQQGKTIQLTLWDAHLKAVTEQNASDHPVLAIRGVRVGDYQGRSLSSTRESNMELHPDLPEAHTLRGWYDTAGQSANFTPVGQAGGSGDASSRPTQRIVIGDITDRQMGLGEKGDYANFVGTIMLIKNDRFSYMAVPDAEGSKYKVSQQGDGTFLCEKNNRTYTSCDHRYVMSLSAADHSGTTWLSMFNEAGELVMGTKAETLVNLQSDDSRKAEFQGYFDQAMFKTYSFKVRAQTQKYNEEERVKVTVLDAKPVDFVQETTSMLETLRSMSK